MSAGWLSQWRTKSLTLHYIMEGDPVTLVTTRSIMFGWYFFLLFCCILPLTILDKGQTRPIGQGYGLLQLHIPIYLSDVAGQEVFAVSFTECLLYISVPSKMGILRRRTLVQNRFFRPCGLFSVQINPKVVRNRTHVQFGPAFSRYNEEEARGFVFRPSISSFANLASTPHVRWKYHPPVAFSGKNCKSCSLRSISGSSHPSHAFRATQKAPTHTPSLSIPRYPIKPVLVGEYCSTSASSRQLISYSNSVLTSGLQNCLRL